MVNSDLTRVVKEMKGLSEFLIPLTFPVVDFKDEQEVLLLKQRNITVDGYDVIVCYSKADYDEYFLESLQIQSSFTPFLPFILVCKLGRMFLGSENLSYIEFFRSNHKVYCWTLKTRDGNTLAPDKRTTPSSYEGFEYSVLDPGSVDLY